MNTKTIAGMVLMVVQVAGLIFFYTQPAKYFCWAPHDEQTVYDLDVTVNGQKLTESEIADRYHKGTQLYWENDKWEWRRVESRSITNVMDIISQYEKTYGNHHDTQVIMKYRVNGHPQQEWFWPSLQSE